ncbi:FHA domain-containing protein [Corynebacterium hylobatis]|uniref:FHA domain-containing protein n=2 Tax=Corynebacterium TaxID=1716 RepID=A0A3R9ZYS6_9CORY|nr:FHA domain-containing protein [Corynebacterium hylobatis]MCS5479974.1 FHA domain-containing protein [Corynebacterium lemuris]RSZ61900.1 FHA domain-containing protein [Corynebacterium hylobatis]
MDSIVLQIFRIGLLLLLWFFIFMAVRAMYRDVKLAGGVQTSAPAAPRRTVVPGRREAAKQLAVVEGPLKGSHMAVGTLEEVVMGRSPDSDFQLGDDFASARHARLFRRGSDWFVEDLDSRNGTFVNGARIDQPEQVGVGSDIKVGRTTVRLVP